MPQTVPFFRSELQEQVLRELHRSRVPLSASDVARQIGMPVSTVSREVRSLVASGVLTSRQSGRRTLVTLNDASPFVPGLRMILGATTTGRFRPSSPLAWKVAAHRKELRRLTAKYGLRRLRLVGSVARNEDGPDSDVDLMVDVPRGRSLGDLAAFADEARNLLGVDVDVVDSASVVADVARTVSREAVTL
ncbi:nucleotidyltransferase domain-containing protein [Isoptericola variabilis]|uniref:DNA polymerase beta domain protein region n=1 Tax=Isoptericola variabilis (strain 225) TaxID=743718 RepID=F6FRF6_ISOV2|nr:nucleotidyltransferase domain-containing protein [Isoptericola variabilis]AEG43917.1 DNA polymerase beta domain protein region [Isoptericola variabilis 225]TWH30506.1 hypothetical protein L600_000300000590 [Isoptericola variabilis J7]